MGKYGLKIKNYSAGSIYEYNLGVRDQYDYQSAMLTNSLFLDFLYQNGLDVWKDEATRDVICIQFNYGSSSYEEQLKRLRKAIKNAGDDAEKIAKIHEMKARLEENRDKCEHMTVQSIRDKFYTNGVDIEYVSRNKNGEIMKKDIIHYKMLYRTPGKAKSGDCVFINESLYDKARNFLYMGIKLPQENAPIVEIGAYSSLITSSIVGRIEIDPRNILILKDVDAFFETNVISIETDENKHCVAKTIQNYKLKNTLFDGQALIDSSIFPSWGDGYILLRHHFTKMAAFHANIQMFFKDYYGDEYETAQVVDMWGNKHYAKDIQLITTDNAIKWLNN